MSEDSNGPEMGQVIDLAKYKETKSVAHSDITGQERDPNKLSLADVKNRIAQADEQGPPRISRWFPPEQRQRPGILSTLKRLLKK